MSDPNTATRLLPTGTITFLFTDIEGSTKLLEQLRERYAIILSESSDILRSLAEKFGGAEVDTAGDSFFIVFPRAGNAALFAFSAQRALAAHTWPDGVTVKIRMGLHTGQAVVSRTGYVGMDVHRAARIMASAYGGQVVLSSTTSALLDGQLPAGITLRELGEYNLKDVGLTHIYQLDIEGLEQSFPPLKTLDIKYDPPAPGTPPFMGLHYFDTADAALFFGRQGITARLLERLQHENFLAVVGASGSGKSSIVRAGVMPALRGTWQTHVITPTANPLQSLAAELTRHIVSVTATATLMDDMLGDRHSLALYLTRHSSSQAPHTLLFIDQFEELFTLTRDENARVAFIDNLLHATQQGAATVILTLRADFYAALAEYAELRDTIAQHQEYIGPMSQGELQSAIQEPAKQNGWEFDAGLVELILHDVGQEPGALPLLSHALLETWNRRSGRRLMLKSYEESGGVRGAIAKTAERVFYQELNDEEQEIARNIFLRLTELGQGTQDTRRRASLSELLPRTPYGRAENVQRVLRHLVDARLITTDEGVAQVAHEALIREWHTLREWLAQDREGLRLHRHLTEAAQEWLLLEHDPDALYRGVRLIQAQEYASAHPERINQNERVFLDASIADAERAEQEKEAARQRELAQAQKLAETESRRAAEQQRGARRLRWFAAGLALLLLIALSAAFFAFNQSNVAQENFVKAERIRIASRAQIVLDDGEGGDVPALLSLASLKYGYSPDADASLLNALKRGFTKQVFADHPSIVWGVNFSPDGRKLVTVGDDARLYDLETGKQIFRFAAPGTEGFTTAAYTPHGRYVVLGGANRMRLWDTETNQEIRQYTGLAGGAWGFDVSSDGKYVVTADDEGAKLFDIQTGALVHAYTLPYSTPAIFSPDDRYIAISSADNIARVWEVSTGKELHQYPSDAFVPWLAFSPDGKSLLTMAGDTAQLWDVQTGEKKQRFIGHVGLVLMGGFSPDGKYVVTGGADKTARIWEIATGNEVQRLIGHTNRILWAEFSPDGRYLATSGEDRTARVWDLRAEAEPRRILTFNKEIWGQFPAALSPDSHALLYTVDRAINAAAFWDPETGERHFTKLEGMSSFTHYPTFAFSPDNQILLGGKNDGVVWMWDTQSGKELHQLVGHTELVHSVVFSSDGRYVLSGSDDKTARLWDAQSGQSLRQFLGHTQGVRAVAFSPDALTVLTGSDDKTGRLWDALTGKELKQFVGHSASVKAVAFSPDGKYVATGSDDQTARVWDASTGKELRQLLGHTSTVSLMTYSPDGRFILTGSTDQTARLWDAQTGQIVREFPSHASQILFANFADNGQTIVTGDVQAIYHWRASLDDVIAFTCSQLTRDLTADERALYRITDPASTCPKFANAVKTPAN